MIRTLDEVTVLAGVDVLDHLDKTLDVPPCTGLMRQGDVYLIPRQVPPAGEPVPAAGVPLVRGEAGGNTHLLVAADGPVLWQPYSSRGQDVGVITIPEGSLGYVLHPEHGAHCLAAGSWLVRRQREQADEVRLVAD